MFGAPRGAPKTPGQGGLSRDTPAGTDVELHSLAVCPRCRGALQRPAVGAPSHVSCLECGRGFPIVGGIPCLLYDASREIAQWCFRAHEFSTDQVAARDTLLAQIVGVDALLPATRARLEATRDALQVHQARVLALAAASGVTPRPREVADHERLPGEGTLTAYYHQIHRDWGWDDDGEFGEVAAARAAVAAVLPEGFGVGHMLVLGAGACRLPWEVHRRHGAQSTLALDLNPLPFWIARRLLAGEVVDLHEFPLHPRSADRAVVDRRLAMHGAPDPSFSFAFADGLDPPVRPHAFDTVFTPWFIDQVPRQLADVFGVLHHTLRPGGTWVNHGPLLYQPHHTAVVHRHCVDEVLALTEAAGFRVEQHTFSRMPYMVSPAGSQGRTEMVLTLRATRVAETMPAVASQRPSWLDDPHAPIPVLAGLATYVAPHPMFAAIVGAIDGRRTAADIGRLLAERHGVPADNATQGVRAALAEIVRALPH